MRRDAKKDRDARDESNERRTSIEQARKKRESKPRNPEQEEGTRDVSKEGFFLTQNVNETDKDSSECSSTQSHDLLLFESITEITGISLRTNAIEAFSSIQIFTDTAIHAGRVETLVVVGTVFTIMRWSVPVFASEIITFISHKMRQMRIHAVDGRSSSSSSGSRSSSMKKEVRGRQGKREGEEEDLR